MTHRIARYVLVALLMVPLVVGCGGNGGDTPEPVSVAGTATTAPTSQPTTAPTAVPPTTEPTAAPTDLPPTAEPTEEPTAEPTVAPTAEPTAVPAGEPSVSMDLPEKVEEGYGMLVMLEASAILVEDLAAQIASGEADDERTMGTVLMLGFMLGMADEVLAEPAPDPALEEAWEEARIALPLLNEALGDWTDGEGESGEIADAIAPVHEQIGVALTAAEEALAAAYGGSAEELAALRAWAIDEMLAELAESGGSGTTPPTASEEALSLRVGEAYWYLDSFDDLIFVGLLHNDGDAPAESASVTITLYSEDGDIVATESGSALLGRIPAGDSAPFKVDFWDNPGEFDRFEGIAQASGSGGWWGEEPYDGLVLSRERVRDEEEDEFSIVIEAENAGDALAGSLQVVVTAFDADGALAGAGHTYSERDVAGPAETATFDVSFGVRAPVDTYTVQFDAREVDERDQPSVEITSMDSFRDGWGDLIYIGEVQNTSDEPVSWATILVTISGPGGELLAAKSTSTLLDLIPAGDSAPFYMDTWEEIPDGEEAVAVVQADVADDWDLNGSYQEFEVLQHNRVKADPDELAVAGVVKNVGNTTAEWITVVMTAYGDDGAVVGAGEAYIEIDELAAGLESPFTVRVTLTAPAADYRLQVEGSPAD